MDLVRDLGRQPLFQLLAGVIVLLIVDSQPAYGFAAFLLWLGWIAIARGSQENPRYL
jgi:membrane-associated protease RseP (regulator of RpoE activity)